MTTGDDILRKLRRSFLKYAVLGLLAALVVLAFTALDCNTGPKLDPGTTTTAIIFATTTAAATTRC